MARHTLGSGRRHLLKDLTSGYAAEAAAPVQGRVLAVELVLGGAPGDDGGDVGVAEVAGAVLADRGADRSYDIMVGSGLLARAGDAIAARMGVGS
jgi:hypothetical protein